jgi:hypothetical protein
VFFARDGAEATSRPTEARDLDEAVPPPPAMPIIGGSTPVDQLCPICLDRVRDVALLDCGHTLCHTCAQSIKGNFGHCYACRSRIKGILRLYNA